MITQYNERWEGKTKGLCKIEDREIVCNGIVLMYWTNGHGWILRLKPENNDTVWDDMRDLVAVTQY